LRTHSPKYRTFPSKSHSGIAPDPSFQPRGWNTSLTKNGHVPRGTRGHPRPRHVSCQPVTRRAVVNCRRYTLVYCIDSGVKARMEGAGATDAVVPVAGKRGGKGSCRKPRTACIKLSKVYANLYNFHCVFPLHVKIRIFRSLRQRQRRPTNPPELERRRGRRRMSWQW
jgi:hypothetical protein